MEKREVKRMEEGRGEGKGGDGGKTGRCFKKRRKGEVGEERERRKEVAVEENGEKEIGEERGGNWRSRRVKRNEKIQEEKGGKQNEDNWK